MDPTPMSGLQDMDTPKTAEELSQFIQWCRWMSLTIPDFAQRAEMLTNILEKAYARTKSKKRTNRSIRNIGLDSLSWGPPHEEAFRSLQESLQSAVKLFFPDPDKVLCVFTDESDRCWSGVVTQVTPDPLKLPVPEQRHKHLAFLSSSFNRTQRNWTTFEKEAYAIFQTFYKLDYLFLNGERTYIFTDHRNLLFVYAPTALEPAFGRHVLSKVQRWALFLSRFNSLLSTLREGPTFSPTSSLDGRVAIDKRGKSAAQLAADSGVMQRR